MSEILTWPDPCPDCGGRAVTVEYHSERDEQGPFTVECLTCRYSLYVPEATTARTRIAALREIVRTHSAKRVEGYLVDATSARACVAVYEKLSPKSREQFGVPPLPVLIEFCFSKVRLG